MESMRPSVPAVRLRWPPAAARRGRLSRASYIRFDNEDVSNGAPGDRV